MFVERKTFADKFEVKFTRNKSITMWDVLILFTSMDFSLSDALTSTITNQLKENFRCGYFKYLKTWDEKFTVV